MPSRVTGAHVGSDNGNKTLSQDIKSRGLCCCSFVCTVNHQVHITMHKDIHCNPFEMSLLHSPELFRQLFLGTKQHIFYSANESHEMLLRVWKLSHLCLNEPIFSHRPQNRSDAERKKDFVQDQSARNIKKNDILGVSQQQQL